MALSKEQKNFIERKVKSFGGMEKVQEFYKKKSLVCEYAHKIAAKLYDKPKLKRRKNENNNR